MEHLTKQLSLIISTPEVGLELSILRKERTANGLSNLKPEDLKDDSLFDLRFRTTLIEVGEETSVRLESITV
jgi:hypothetical protein